MKTAMRCGLIVGMLAVAAVIVGIAAAEDVIVKQGTIGTGSVSPDERAKVFVSDGADDVTDEYGLLSITTDATGGSDYTTGLMCEFFPDASEEGPNKFAGQFRNCPVGTEGVSPRYYYGLSGSTRGMPDQYTISEKSISFYGIGYSVENANDVVGGDPFPVISYKTCGLWVSSKPVNDGYDMTGSVNFTNYGIEVWARLEGDYNATLGSGENCGVFIKTLDSLDAEANHGINSYALLLEPFTSNSNLCGGETYGLYQRGANVENCFEGNLTVDGIFDNTPGYIGTAQEALNEILNVRSFNGEIDHSSLPALARATTKRVEKTNVRIVERTDPSGKVVEVEEYDTQVVEEDARSLGAMITVLTEAVKGLNEKIEALQAENQLLKSEVAALKLQ